MQNKVIVSRQSCAFRIVLLVLTAAAAGCGANPLTPGEVRALAGAERRWAARGFQDYVFELRRSCFCPLEINQWARVEVVAGRVARGVSLETGAELPLTWFLTVERVFDAIRTAGADDSVKEVVAEFDPDLGFPSYVTVRLKPNIQDGDISYHLRNAGPIR